MKFKEVLLREDMFLRILEPRFVDSSRYLPVFQCFCNLGRRFRVLAAGGYTGGWVYWWPGILVAVFQFILAADFNHEGPHFTYTPVKSDGSHSKKEGSG
jgi:hypothetical protein